MTNIHFKNAPITEAVFDIQVVLPVGFNFNEFDSLKEKISGEYPTREVSVNYETLIDINKGGTPKHTTKKQTDGFIFKSSDSKKIIQFKTSGFTFNKLKPYDNWKNFSDEAKKYFEEYVKIAKPIKITRVGLRYINLLNIPLPIKDFKEYIKTVPEIGSEIPQNIQDFFMRLLIPQTDNPLNKAIITETIGKINPTQTKENILPLIFDIDVFRTDNLDLDPPKLYKIFDELREFKNCIFINSITENVKELIS
ncbi:MAG: TIGR04255 family protein [Methanoregula sp.]|jgi:uncharacterized protein (TIGR04255 family)|nr:TIGR04255 family protein [Methanoregula sp.]